MFYVERMDYDHFIKFYDVSRRTFDSLQQYVQLLLKWNQKLNLIGRSTEDEIWERHILDSVQLANHISKTDKILDIGSGAGLPGVVISIISGNKVILVEKDTKKCAFLNEVKAKIAHDIEIINDKIENTKIEGITIITARAVADFTKILELTYEYLKNGVKLILLKGERFEDEINKAMDFGWRFEIEKFKSLTNPRGIVIIVTNVSKI